MRMPFLAEDERIILSLLCGAGTALLTATGFHMATGVEGAPVAATLCGVFGITFPLYALILKIIFE